MLISSLPGANSRFPEHKIGIFVLGKYVLGVARVVLLGSCCTESAAPARVVLLGVWRGLFVCSNECEELFSEGGGVCEE